MKKILNNSLFLCILISDLLSNFGDMVYYLALLNYVLLVPNSKLALSIVTFSEILPSFMGVITGYLADKTYDKLGVIKCTLLFRVVLYTILGICMGFEPALWIVIIAAIFNVFSDFAGFYENGLYAPLGLRVVSTEDRESYVAFRQTVTGSFHMVFQGVSAILVTFLAYNQLAFLNAGTFLVAFLIMQALTPRFNKLLADNPLKMTVNTGLSREKSGLLASFKLAVRELRSIPEFRLILITSPFINACAEAILPILLLLISEDKTVVWVNTETTIAVVMLSIFLGKMIGASLVFTLFKKTSMVKLEMSTILAVMGIYVGMLLHNLPFLLLATLIAGITVGANGPKFNAKFVNSMPEEQLATIGGGVSTYFMLGSAFVRLLVSGLVLILSAGKICWIFLIASTLLGLYAAKWIVTFSKISQNQSV